MQHNFRKSLLHEKEQSNKADAFYADRLKVNEILRYNHDTPEDMAMQHADIDVSVRIGERRYNVSEKFRDVDYGDLYVELYSKYPHTQGWMHTGNPDVIVYFTPSKVCWVQHSSLNRFCFGTLFPAISQDDVLQFYLSELHFKPVKILLSEKTVRLKLIKADNKDGAEWTTIGLAIPFGTLRDFGVKFKEFALQ
jgi:hypothetical protein